MLVVDEKERETIRKGTYNIPLNFRKVFSQFYWYIKPYLLFCCQQHIYRYFCHPYNWAFTSERTIEIPIVLKMLKDVRHENILEVGNVLSNYFNMKHDIVDKYEMIDDVIQQDIVDYSPIKTYELIVSISTIEHIGFDENIKEPDKVIKAIENLKSLLEPKGKIIVSFPMGYNTYLDNLYMQNIFLFQHRFCLKRISRLNFWKEVPLSKIVNPKYDYPYPSGNWVVFGIFDNS